ncbi:unnamed protein product [Chondrus crispus]|uniref:Uncharacterized protein n=1 Tax=Chondrus crispus TaxID=2769 RepID=R7QEV9_CHOCR|nr:unnamed protein product [Chondrus crispus]CDF36323.1 unnamed protein product [Chondrus crispus]|eukprot:XP_005716142.1 unnamed protein product [Chondrus crispus]
MYPNSSMQPSIKRDRSFMTAFVPDLPRSSETPSSTDYPASAITMSTNTSTTRFLPRDNTIQLYKVKLMTLLGTTSLPSAPRSLAPISDTSLVAVPATTALSFDSEYSCMSWR